MSYAIVLFALIAFLCAWRAVRKAPTVTARILFVFMAVASATESVAAILSLNGIFNQWLYNLYFPFEFMTLVLLSLRTLALARAPMITLALGGVFISGELIETLTGAGFGTMATTTYIIGGVVLCALSIAGLFKLADTVEARLRHHPLFWILLATVLWFGGCIPLTGVLNYLDVRDHDLTLNLYRAIQALCIVRYAMMAYGNWRGASAPDKGMDSAVPA